MSTITTNPLHDQRARIAADAVVSAYINELGSRRPPVSRLRTAHGGRPHPGGMSERSRVARGGRKDPRRSA
jgi:hypothetical protein